MTKSGFGPGTRLLRVLSTICIRRKGVTGESQVVSGLNEKITYSLLTQVKTPAQYIGGEVNQIRREYRAGDVTVALAFPDTYAIGMSHLGLGILYTALNRMDGVIAERVFCPWLDAAEIMRREGIPLFSWESRKPVRDFDILGISLQHELCYSNVLYLLDLAGITFESIERHDDEPLVMGGGPMADCCEPVADFFDLIIIGDGEEALPAVVEAYRKLRDEKCKRREILLNLARQFSFVYVPQFYHCEYGHDGLLTVCEPTEPDIPRCVQRAQVKDLDATVFPTAPIIPYAETTHERIAIEIMRGCPQRCAFCHAGHTKGPVRCRSVDKIVELAWESYLNTGYDTVSLLSLSSSDYPGLNELVTQLYQRFAGRHVGISLPSLRVDKQLQEIPSQVTGVRREGLTVAVETASDRIRRAIGKKVTDDDLLATMQAAFEAGWHTVKLYFMIGFPGETQEDIMAILDLAVRISNLSREVTARPAKVNAAISWLVPKPHTPFAWIPQQSMDYFQNTKDMLIQAKRNLRGVPIKLKFHHLQRSMLEGVFARGDRRLSRVILAAYRAGARFDAWDECFDVNHYLEAFRQCNLDPAFYARRTRTQNEILPWQHLSGDNHDKLYQRLQRIMSMLTDENE
ncbi:MAG: TIGR03960 family B12-binding radical SAM protein [Sedimentisphaerales bacterium]|nr:TIGR03960 family B12-binding radical SAM protein [Sedimentisphaerales bacterium]